MKIHIGERPFVCEMRNRKFLLKYDLLNHQKSHSRPIINHPCDEYNECFISKSNLLALSNMSESNLFAQKRTTHQHMLKRKTPLAMHPSLKDTLPQIASMH